MNTVKRNVEAGTIKGNVRVFNAELKKMLRYGEEAAEYILGRIVMDIKGELMKKTPVAKEKGGTLRLSWKTVKLSPLQHIIYNYQPYIIYIEYGAAYEGHPLSSNPQKRKNSLRYLFAKGILESQDGIVVYHYTPVLENKTGFVRSTIMEFAQTAGDKIQKYMKEYMEKRWNL